MQASVCHFENDAKKIRTNEIQDSDVSLWLPGVHDLQRGRADPGGVWEQRDPGVRAHRVHEPAPDQRAPQRAQTAQRAGQQEDRLPDGSQDHRHQ